MKLLTFITKGKAVVTPDGLRCAANRPSTPDRRCNKLIAKRNDLGQISGSFRCERCRQDIDVELKPPPPKSDLPAETASRTHS